jgi:hypothetical protein
MTHLKTNLQVKNTDLDQHKYYQKIFHPTIVIQP